MSYITRTTRVDSRGGSAPEFAASAEPTTTTTTTTANSQHRRQSDSVWWNCLKRESVHSMGPGLIGKLINYEPRTELPARRKAAIANESDDEERPELHASTAPEVEEPTQQQTTTTTTSEDKTTIDGS